LKTDDATNPKRCREIQRHYNPPPTSIKTASLADGRDLLGGDSMKIAISSKYDEQACILDERSQAATAGAGNDCLIITMPPPEVIAQWHGKDDCRELKRIVRDLRWTAMISDALVVLAITGAIYFLPSLETLRAAVERTAVSVAEASRAR
jgi:hypothetical protein